MCSTLDCFLCLREKAPEMYTALLLCSISLTLSQCSASLRVVTWNIANAMRDEERDNYRFGVRMDNIIQKLRELKPDILCIQEFRQCKDKTGDVIMSAEDIMFKFRIGLNMEFRQTALNPDNESFHYAIFYDRSKVFPTEQNIRWMGDSSYTPGGTGYGKLFFHIRFIVLERSSFKQGTFRSGPLLDVYNCHFPLGGEDRLKYSRVLNRHITDLSAVQASHFIVVGDFNTLGPFNEEQLSILKENLVDVSGNISHTFRAFPHDTNPVTRETYPDSKLDYVFTDHELQIYSIRTEDVSADKLSDHWPVITEIDVSSMRITKPRDDLRGMFLYFSPFFF